MRAITYSHPGASDVLELVHREVPHPGPGEVRVRIAVSGVNPTDWKARSGSSRSRLPTVPQVPNQDGAGVVDRVGGDVTALRVGQRVWVWDAAWQRPDGTAQEYTVVPEHQAVPLPDGASFDVGASVGIPALTAHLALTASILGPDVLGPGALAGTTVLVAGGAGAVGHAAIQLASWAGARVVSTVSSEGKAELAGRAGADRLVNYRAGNAADLIREFAPDGVHLVVEVNPVANMDLNLAVVAPNATIASYASDDATVPIPFGVSMSRNLDFRFLLTYTVDAARKALAVQAVTEAMGAGALEVGEPAGLPIRRFRLEDTAAAHDAVESGFVGKVLIDVASV